MTRILVTASLKGRPALLLQLASIPVGVIAVAVWWLAFGQPVGSMLWERFENFELSIAATLALIVVHEVLHFVSFPRFGTDGYARFGISLKLGAFYAQYCRGLERNRYMVAAAMPLLVLSALPLAYCLVQGFSPWAAFISCLNASMAMGDLYILFCMATRAPKGAVVAYDEDGFFATMPDDNEPLPATA